MASAQMMSSTLVSQSDELSSDERWQLALRIASSPLFSKATQLREILLYITRRWLLDESVTIREQEIACRVLGRRSDFNPAEDNIVRVQISHLRRKLDEYFKTAGNEEALELSIPRGSYAPRFEIRSVSSAPPPVSILHALEESPERSIAPEPPAPAECVPAPGPAPSGVLRSRWPIALAASLALVLVGVLWFSWNSRSASAAVRAESQNPIIRRIFDSNQPVSVVVADTNLVALQNELQTDISIADYVNREYPENILHFEADPKERAFLKGLALRRFTSLADVNVSARCAELGAQFGSKPTISYARNMNARDFEHGNFILIGSRTADPWVELFEPQLNFAYERDPVTHVFHFRNKHPLPGEEMLFFPSMRDDSSTTSYVDVALVPNLTRTGYVLLLNAATMDANEAAMRLVLGKQLSPSLSKLLPLEQKGNGIEPSIEIFLRDHAINGVVSSYEVLSVRRIG